MKSPSFLLLTGAAFLSSLSAAQVDLTKNSVRTGGSLLQSGSVLAPGTPLSTGSKSKTQLSVGSNGSLLRAGSKTDLILQNDQALSLRQGVMLASSGKKTFGRESISVDTPAVKASAKGSMLVAYQPDVYVKITCIEGEVTVKLKALLGEFVRLRAGQMVIINPAGKQLPEEVEVDLRELNATSSLLSSDFPELGAAPRLERAADKQAKSIGGGDVVRTPLVMAGAGLEVTLETNAGVDAQRTEIIPEVPDSTPPPSPRSGGGGGAPIAPLPPAEYVIDGTTVFLPSALPPCLQTPGLRLVVQSNPGSATTPNLWNFPNSNPSLGPELLFRGITVVPSLNSLGDEFQANGDIALGDGAPTEILGDGPLSFVATGNLMVDAARIGESGGGSGTGDSVSHGLSFDAGQILAVSASDLSHQADIALLAPTVSVSNTSIRAGSSSASTAGINIYSPAQSAGSGSITIGDSSVLQAMAARSFITLQTNGAAISVLNSRLQANDIDLDTLSSAADSLIQIRNSVLSADQVRATAYNSGDRDAIIIDSSTVNAASLIWFYAEGSSRLRFQGNTTINLGANGQALLAGKTVQVDAGGAVSVNGNARVFRDNDNYNKTGFGTLDATGSLDQQPFANRP